MPRALAPTVVAALPLAALFWLSGEVSLPAALGAMALLVFVVFSTGFLLLRAAGSADMGAPAAWVAGIAATAVALYALIMVFSVLAATAFALWALPVLGAAWHFRRAETTRRGELLALLLCAAATLYWCWDLAQVPFFLARDGVMTTWVDQFGHGATISQFGDPRSAGGGFNQLAGAPLPAYHYASYVLPAVLAWPLDLPGLPLATSVWVPLGFFTLCAGIYVLGSALAGRMGGVLALAALTLLPDPASYGLGSRGWGYYWYQIQVPGGSYGAGIGLLAFALLQRWAREHAARPLVASAVMLAVLAPIRVHIFLLAFPAWLLSTLCMIPGLERRKLLVLGSSSVLFALFVFAYYGLRADATPALPQFLELARNPYLPLYHGWYPEFSERYGTAAALVVGVLLVFPACLGVFFVLYPASLLLLHRARRLEAFDLVPGAFLFSYLLLLVTAPVPAHDDVTEFTQRPFVLLYALIAVWTCANFARWLKLQGGLRAMRVRLALVAIAALWVAGTLLYTVKDSRWQRVHEQTAGLPQAARYLRGQWRPGDVLAVEGLSRWRVFMDDAMKLVSLTGMPAYLSVPWVRSTLGGQREEVALRQAALAEVAEAHDLPAALARLRSLRIRWYVVPGPAGPRWDRERRGAAFAHGEIAVYASAYNR